MTRPQAILARALDISDGKPLPTYVQRRATELEYYLQDCRLPADHPVVQAHVAEIVTDWRAHVAAQSMGQSAMTLYGAIGKTEPPPPPRLPQGTCPRAVWRLLSQATTGTPTVERLPATVLARAGELERLLREGRLPTGHPAVRAHAARIVSNGRVLEAAGLALQAAKALRAWREDAKRRQAILDRREQELEAKEAVLSRRQEALDAQDATLTERARVLHAQEKALELKAGQAQPAAPGIWARIVAILGIDAVGSSAPEARSTQPPARGAQAGQAPKKAGQQQQQQRRKQ